jgi:hypothetical protein
MIIFYNKTTGDILGTIEGRVHREDELAMTICPQGVSSSDVGKYIVPTKTKTTKGVKEVIPDVSFSKLIYEFEAQPAEIYKNRLKLDKTNKVIGFVKKEYTVYNLHIWLQ